MKLPAEYVRLRDAYAAALYNYGYEEYEPREAMLASTNHAADVETAQAIVDAYEAEQEVESERVIGPHRDALDAYVARLVARLPVPGSQEDSSKA